jgi:hypothetical protein
MYHKMNILFNKIEKHNYFREQYDLFWCIIKKILFTSNVLISQKWRIFYEKKV